MTNLEYKKAFKILKKNLFDNYAIYHERVTILIQIVSFIIGNEEVKFKAKVVKPLNKAAAESNKLYHHMIAKSTFSFSASYLFGVKDTNPLLHGSKVGRPYCPFKLWLDPELAEFVLKNGDEITRQIPPYILWSEDWRIVIDKNKIL